jgi:hypothetical protein
LPNAKTGRLIWFTVLEGADLFKVELIDPWRMKVYPLGYTRSGGQAFRLPLVSALLRITAATNVENSPQPINVLAANFVAETADNLMADPTLFKAPVLSYSTDYQLGMLEQRPAARAALEKHLPRDVLLQHRLTAFPVAALPMFLPSVTEQQIKDVQADLMAIPVE